MKPEQDSQQTEEEYDQMGLDEHDEIAPSSPQASSSIPAAAGDKKQVIRGARACMVCRTAKMRCIGGDDQASDVRPCNRCKKNNVACVFEKHRRGRKPGVKINSSTGDRSTRGVEKQQLGAAAGPSSARPKLEDSSPYPIPQTYHPPVPPRKYEYDDGSAMMEVDSVSPVRQSAARSQPPPASAPAHMRSQSPPRPRVWGPPYFAPQAAKAAVVEEQHQHHHPASLSPSSSYHAQQHTPTHAEPSFNHTAGPSSPRHRPEHQQHQRQASAGQGSGRTSAEADDGDVHPGVVLVREKERTSRFLKTVLNNPPGEIPPPPTIQDYLRGDEDDADDAPSSPNPAGGPPKAKRKGKGKGKKGYPMFKRVKKTLPNWEQMLPECYQVRKVHLPDPVELGFLSLDDARWLLDKIFVHLNPFVNLFDPVLHTVEYIRTKSPFLFTVLMMAGCKFWREELYKPLQRMAFVMATKAFDEQWKSVEVVQAFSCLMYWKEPDDNRTWVFIGYACRLAIELKLNDFSKKPNPNETELETRERRNRERTYLVLFVHDRSLAMQTGRPWMLQEDDLIRSSTTWHRPPRNTLENRPEDVIVGAFVGLRRLSAETNDVFYLREGSTRDNSDVSIEILLNGCNTKLTAWMEYWEDEMRRANGNEFHFLLLRFFRLHIRPFLNSLGLNQREVTHTGTLEGSGFSIQALSLCYTSAKDTLNIVEQLKDMDVLQYGQDVCTVMSAYAAIFLLRLVKRHGYELIQGMNVADIHELINQSGMAFWDGDDSSTFSTHARFLWNLVYKDQKMAIQQAERAKQSEQQSRAVSTHNTGAPNDMLPPSTPVVRDQTESTTSLSVNTEIAYSSHQSMVSNTPMSAHSTSDIRSPTGHPPQPRPENLSISTSGRPPIHPSSFSSSAETIYHSAQSSSHPAQWHQQNPGAQPSSNGMGYGNHPPRAVTYESQPYYQQRSNGQYGAGVQTSASVSSPDLATTQQLLMHSVPSDPNIDSQYSQHMYEQLGIQSGHLSNSVSFIGPTSHPHLPIVGDHHLLNQF